MGGGQRWGGLVGLGAQGAKGGGLGVGSAMGVFLEATIGRGLEGLGRVRE